MFNLKLNFFANYSSVVQAIISRIDAVLNRLLKINEKSK